MIIDGVVYREGHPSWCTCDECEAGHPGKREFFAAAERIGKGAQVHEDYECGDCGSMQMLLCERCGSGYCMACALIGGTSPAEAMADHQSFLAKHAHSEVSNDA